jgi:hypothetical protein
MANSDRLTKAETKLYELGYFYADGEWRPYNHSRKAIAERILNAFAVLALVAVVTGTAACASAPPDDAVSEAKRVCEGLGAGKDVGCLVSVYKTQRPATTSEILLGK